MNKENFLIICIIISFNIFGNSFQDGNLEFINKDYEKAEISYLNDIKENGEDLNTLFNLANLYIIIGEDGKALLNLYKARIISPGDKSITKEIENIEDKLNIKNQYKYFIPLSYNHLFFITIISLLIFSISIFILSLLKKNIYFSIIPLGFFLLFLSLLININSHKNDIIAINGSEVYISPYPGSDSSFKLEEGSIARVEEEHGDFLFITDKENRYGWILKNNIGFIWKQ
ncbi:MAG: hypothetical protein JXR64_10245 [Spirochaetales bacterium]|nr:hypothetical protein [Spirochaetales bacterium]